MNHTNGYLHFERLDVWVVAIELVKRSWQIADDAPAKSGDFADQLRRASLSITGNLAEGFGRVGKDRARFHRAALGSALEAGAHVIAGVQLQLVNKEAHASHHALAVRVVSMLTRMTR